MAEDKDKCMEIFEFINDMNQELLDLRDQQEKFNDSINLSYMEKKKIEEVDKKKKMENAKNICTEFLFKYHHLVESKLMKDSSFTHVTELQHLIWTTELD